MKIHIQVYTISFVKVFIVITLLLIAGDNTGDPAIKKEEFRTVASSSPATDTCLSDHATISPPQPFPGNQYQDLYRAPLCKLTQMHCQGMIHGSNCNKIS